jgi:hypothetical protein
VEALSPGQPPPARQQAGPAVGRASEPAIAAAQVPPAIETNAAAGDELAVDAQVLGAR